MIVEVLVLENNFENLCYNINFFFFQKKDCNEFNKILYQKYINGNI